MPLHHYLPATFLASFSSDSSTLPRRNRRLYVGDVKKKRVFSAPASKVGAVNNLYTVVSRIGANADPEVVDRIWSDYERELAEAIKLLIAGKVDARTWARVLVPFVSCLFVRGLDFNERFDRRMDGIDIEDLNTGLLSKDNTNVARLMELQRLLGPVAVAKWIVIRVLGQKPLVTNDLGYAPFTNSGTNEAGVAIPLDSSNVLAIVPRIKGRVAVARPGRWIPVIGYVEEPPDNHELLNQVLCATAQRFVFGPDKEVVEKELQRIEELQKPSAQPFLPEPWQLGFISPRWARAHEFTWHRLAVAIERDPADGDPWDFPLDIEKLAQGWAPPPSFATNLPEFPPALRREGPSIVAEFYDPTDHYEAAMHHDRGVALFDSGEYNEAVEALNTSLELMSDRVATLYYKGTALAKLGRHDKALEAYDAALDLEPGNAQVLFNKGITLDELGRPEDAIAAYDEDLMSEPDHADALTNKGAVLAEQGRDDEALKAFDAVLRLKPDGPDMLVNKGGVLGKMGRHGEAAEVFETALEIRPEHEPALRYKTIALVLQGKEAEAEAHFHRGWHNRERLSHKGALLAPLLRGPPEEAGK